MELSFLKYFKRKGAAAPAAVVASPPVVVDKPSSDRFSKTVRPSATRIIPSTQDPFQFLGGESASIPQTVPFNTSAPKSNALPPAVAIALAPRVERVLPFALSDVLGQMPPGLVRPLAQADGDRRILLKAAELERGMADGRPAVSIATIYQQVPEIFVKAVEASDPAQVALPFAKVLEQFASLHQRTDQMHEQALPQVETPFLKVTIEDDTKFGTRTAPSPVQTEALPPVRVLPATAQSIAAAEPEAAAREIIPTIPPPIAMTPLRNAAQKSASNGHAKTNGNGSNGHAAASADSSPKPEVRETAPTRIPFNISPKGTGVPAAERVPASTGGASVPTSFNPSAPGPARIPFKITSAGADAPAQGEPRLTKEAPSENELRSPAPNETKISLPLKPIMQGLPPFQLTGDVKSVPNEATIELPFSLVAAQLASGRVTLTPEQFAAALPEQFRSFFSAKDIAAPVSLPLQDVLRSLPAASLRMRDDQIEQERGSNFATPFSATAEEDAKRFQAPPQPVAKPEVCLTSAAPAPVEVAPAARTILQEILGTDETIDAKRVVAHIEKMDGLAGCAIMFGDGLNLAGKLPDGYEADGLCAMAPSLLQRVENHLVETKLGAVASMTVSCTRASITFFMHEDLCLAALHLQSDLAADARAQLSRIMQELARTYSKPA
ncbi:MAG: hypothetical protein M3Y86_12210 [Verrucomicrobiota bacterium]|nr:hypothetical protein [Verrucomicrobiota bacterium]